MVSAKPSSVQSKHALGSNATGWAMLRSSPPALTGLVAERLEQECNRRECTASAETQRCSQLGSRANSTEAALSYRGWCSIACAVRLALQNEALKSSPAPVQPRARPSAVGQPGGA